MALNHKALFTWLMLLSFFVLLVVRLDEKVPWNWFIIFIPMWLFDTVCLIYNTFYMITHCKNGFDWRDRGRDVGLSMKRKVWCLFIILLKLAFQVLLCLKLQWEKEGGDRQLRLVYVMAPLWILLLGVGGDIMKSLIALWNIS